MPVLDGWQFLDELNQISFGKKIVVFIVSSSIDPSDLEMTKKYPMVTNYIVKPINSEKLKKATLLFENEVK